MHGYHDHTYLKGNSPFSRHKRNSIILILETKEHYVSHCYKTACVIYAKWILMYLVIVHVIRESSFVSSQYLRLRSDL